MNFSGLYGEELDKLVVNYLQSRDTKGLLLSVVELFGFLPEEVLQELAERLMLSNEELFALAATMDLSTTGHRGKHLISICSGTSCYVKSSNQLLKCLTTELGITPGETTQDGLFTLEIVHCLGACGFGPNMMIGGLVYTDINPEKISRIINKYRLGTS